MHRWFAAITLASASLALWVATGQARVAFIPPPPLAVQLGSAEVVFVGRVVGVEPQDIEVPVAPKAKETIKYRVAVVKVVDPIVGAKELKDVRVAFTPNPEKGPGGRIRVLPGQNPHLEVGFNGLFVLTRHGSVKNLYVGEGPYTIRAMGDEAPNNPDVKSFKQLAKLLDNPMAGLTSKNAPERFDTATMLVHRYRTFRGPGEPKEEQIPAEESKLILKAISEGNWEVRPVRGGGGAQMSAFQLFLQLGVTDKDGYKVEEQAPVKSAREWIEKNIDTYRVKRFVAVPAAQQGGNAGGSVRINVIRD